MKQHKHLLDLYKWSKENILALFDTADAMAEIMQRTIQKVPALQSFTIGTLFFENSTRTKLSFERAAKIQSAEVLNFAAGSSSLSKGESLKDTIKTIDAMQIDAYVVRHHVAGVPYQLTDWTDAHIINAGDGRRSHPTQALLDGYTFKNEFTNFDGFEGKKLAIIGDIVHSRVARSNIVLWTKLGAEISLCGPKTLLPQEFADDKVTLTHNINEAVEGAHIVMVLRLQQERMLEGLLPSIAEYQACYQLNETVMQHAHPHALIMHPGPMNRDIEISSSLADSDNSVITKQVAKGIPIRMAVFYKLLIGKQSP